MVDHPLSDELINELTWKYADSSAHSHVKCFIRILSIMHNTHQGRSSLLIKSQFSAKDFAPWEEERGLAF